MIFTLCIFTIVNNPQIRVCVNQTHHVSINKFHENATLFFPHRIPIFAFFSDRVGYFPPCLMRKFEEEGRVESDPPPTHRSKQSLTSLLFFYLPKTEIKGLVK